MSLFSSDWLSILSTAITGGEVVITLLYGQKQNQLRATVDLVIDQKKSDELKSARKIFAVARTNDSLAKWACKEHAASPEAQSILLLLNNYEFIAASMRDKAFNLSLYKRMSYSVVVSDWLSLKAFIHEKRVQVNHQTLFQEFEWLANQFNKNPLKQDN